MKLKDVVLLGLSTAAFLGLSSEVNAQSSDLPSPVKSEFIKDKGIHSAMPTDMSFLKDKGIHSAMPTENPFE